MHAHHVQVERAIYHAVLSGARPFHPAVARAGFLSLPYLAPLNIFSRFNPPKLMRHIDPDTIHHSEAHRYLLSGVAPRPIAFVGTLDGEGRPNLAPFSFFNAFG